MNENATQPRAATAATNLDAATARTPPDAAAAAVNLDAAAVQADPVLAAIAFNASGLVPAIAQQHDTGEVLMMAWMNAEAVRETLATGRVCYFSRSRGALWRKGETSGQAQHLKELRVDCDGDTLLLLVHQDGVACHTGRRNCFFRAARGDGLQEIARQLVSPEALYGHAPHGHEPPGHAHA